MSQTSKLEWTDLSSSPPQANAPRVPKVEVSNNPINVEYFSFNGNGLGGQPLIEGVANMTADVAPGNGIANTVVGRMAVLAGDNTVTAPIIPGYIPTLGETQTQDITDMIDRENTTFVLAAIAGVSVVVFGTMILSDNI
jgi:hypothetical protein